MIVILMNYLLLELDDALLSKPTHTRNFNIQSFIIFFTADITGHILSVGFINQFFLYISNESNFLYISN
jgi:hypothetical protein